MADKNLAEMLWENVENLIELRKKSKCAVCGGENALSLATYRFDGRYYCAYFCPRCRNALKRLGVTDDNVILEQAEEKPSFTPEEDYGDMHI